MLQLPNQIAARSTLTTPDWQFFSANRTIINDDGLKELTRLNRLTTLHLNATNVSDRGLKHLAMIKGLRKLRLLGTSVATQGIEDLQDQLPTCEIVY